MKKKLIIVLLLCTVCTITFSQDRKSKEQRKLEKRARLSQLLKQEEEGALIYQKQNAFGVKLNTDGYGIFYEHGKYKTIKHTNLWWLELGERKHPKEEKITVTADGFYPIGNPYIFGKINNFYYFKLGFGQQVLLGGKGNKNGVAVTGIYGGGFSAGLLKPYYLSVIDREHNTQQDIKYSPETDSVFRDPSSIIGSSGFTKGFGEVKFVPGVYARAAVRFDYGRYNEVLSAIEVGVNAEYYTKEMQIMLDNKGPKFFFNGYVALVFGKRK